MNTSIITFDKRIDSLRHFLDGVNQEKRLLSAPVPGPSPSPIETILQEFKAHRQNFVDKKLFDYFAAIVSLYGCLENLIESIAKGYLNHLNKTIPRYEALPERIKNNHVDLSADLVKRLNSTKYQNVTDRERIVRNLHSCLPGQSSYCLNVDAYTYHSANFRYGVINDFFKQLGIDNIISEIKTKKVFIDLLDSIGIDTTVTEESNLFFYLDDLATRRNDVAHGVPCGDILSTEMLLDYIKYINAFSQALFEVLTEHTLEFEVKFNSIIIGSAIKIINDEIICINLKDIEVEAGDRIFARVNHQEKYFGGEIQEIQVDHVTMPRVEASPSIDVGLKVNFKAKENQEFYLAKK